MTQPESPKYICPHCNSDLKYVSQYDQWWCEKCQVYPFPKSEVKKAVEGLGEVFKNIESELGTKSCDRCGIRMTYIKEYKQWWCPNCKRYTSKPPPPPPPAAENEKN